LRQLQENFQLVDGGLLAAGTPPVQPLWRAALLEKRNSIEGKRLAQSFALAGS
jgi:hypothetical protein